MGSITLDRRDNNFDLLRLIAAWLVLFSHSYPLSGQPVSDPFERYVGIDTFGGVGVAIFFVLSGYLVTQSWDRSGGVIDFLWKRARRIYPALIVCVLLTGLVLGPLWSDLDLTSYLTHPQTREYLRTASAWRIHYALPGVFSHNPYSYAINGSLWSLPYEIRCYLTLLLMGVLPFAMRWKVLLITTTLVVMLLYRPASPPAGAFDHVLGVDYYVVKLGLFFAVGASYYCWRHRVQPLWWLGLLGLLAAIFVLPQSSSRVTLYVLAFATTILGLALKVRWLPHLPKKMGDWSYGLYLYAFPIQQICSHFRMYERIGFWGYVLVCTALSLAAAALSWFIVERRWLARRTPPLFTSLPTLPWRHRADGASAVASSLAPVGAVNDGLAALSILRFVAAVIVVIFHFGLSIEPISRWIGLHGLLQGSVAVSFFFVLSGFVLTAAYATRLLNGEVSAKRFWRARLARVYPIYLLGGLLAVVLLSPPVRPFAFLSYALMLQAWMPPQALAVNGVGWALSVEVACFALFPWLLRRASTLPPKRLLLIAFLAWLVTLAVFAVVYEIVNPPYPSGRHNFLFLSPIWHVHEFFIGIAAALALRDARLLDRTRSSATASVLLALVVICSVLTIWPNPYSSVGLLSPAFALLIVGVYCMHGAATAFMTSRLAQTLGDASYAIYILQLPIMLTSLGLLRHMGVSPSASFWISALVLVLLSVITLVTVERPLRAWLRGS